MAVKIGVPVSTGEGNSTGKSNLSPIHTSTNRSSSSSLLTETATAPIGTGKQEVISLSTALIRGANRRVAFALGCRDSK